MLYSLLIVSKWHSQLRSTCRVCGRCLHSSEHIQAVCLDWGSSTCTVDWIFLVVATWCRGESEHYHACHSLVTWRKVTVCTSKLLSGHLHCPISLGNCMGTDYCIYGQSIMDMCNTCFIWYLWLRPYVVCHNKLVFLWMWTGRLCLYWALFMQSWVMQSLARWTTSIVMKTKMN